MPFMTGQINPLAFPKLDLSSAPDSPDLPNDQDVLKFVCSPGVPADAASMASRYREIASEPVRLFVAPAERRILDKLVWPLRHAKASYMVGNYLAVIALTGMVAEMVAILRWDIAEVSMNGRPMTSKIQKAMFGNRSFERLGQEQSIKVLEACGLIDGAAKERFETIRKIRRGYLHLWSQDHHSLPGDAIKSYHAAVALVATIIGQDFSDGKIVISQELVKYLEREGVYKADD